MAEKTSSYPEESDEGIDNEEEEEEEYDEDDDEEEDEDEIKTISVKVQEAKKGAKVEIFKIDRDIELRWLMVRYCDKVGMSHGCYTTKFMFNGVRLRDTDTPLLLNMLDHDVIYVYPKNYLNRVPVERIGICYGTLCIRMHKKRDALVRVTRHEPLLHQLQRHFSNDRGGNNVSICFLLNGSKLEDDSTMESCSLEDGDIIDAFNFEESGSFLSITTPAIQCLSLKVKHHNGDVKIFNVRRNYPLKRLVHKYAEIIGLKSEDVALYFDGRRLSLGKTVEDEHLFDGCHIDFVIHLRG